MGSILLGANKAADRPAAWTLTSDLYDRAAADPEGYWSAWADQLDWMRSYNTVLDWQPPQARWFDGGRMNASVNCIDRHVAAGRGDMPALLWEGEPGDRRTVTYHDLLDQVARCARGLRRIGVGRGDRVVLYLPLLPEALIACLACARLGAVHSVVFAGLGRDSLRERIQDLDATIIITADFGWRRGKKILLQQTVDAVAAMCDCVQRVVVVCRHNEGPHPSLLTGRDMLWQDLLGGGGELPAPEAMAAEDPLFVLYTSGTTGRPKGIVHSTGGYMTGVYATTRLVFDLQPSDVFWCTADIGWITGHSYVLYGPLSHGATVLLYEGAPDWPDRHRWWELIARYGVTVLYTAPTAVRMFMQWGVKPRTAADISSLRLLGSVGEPINPAAWEWYQRSVGGGTCPVVDTWWQTETGSIMIAPLPGITPAAPPGSAARPLPGIAAAVLDDGGKRITGRAGYLALTKPWPSMLRGILNDSARYRTDYWLRWGAGIYVTGDRAQVDAQGHYWLLGRSDDVIQVAGHRLSPTEIESALVGHAAVAEAAVIGVPDALKGEVIVAFVTRVETAVEDDALPQKLADYVVECLGSIARPHRIAVVSALPKTRSGKIMRRVLRAAARGQDIGDISTLADAGSAAIFQSMGVKE